jgi:hypothetical protein
VRDRLVYAAGALAELAAVAFPPWRFTIGPAETKIAYLPLPLIWQLAGETMPTVWNPAVDVPLLVAELLAIAIITVFLARAVKAKLK